MRASVKEVIRDPSKFGMLATNAQRDMIKAAHGSVNQMAGRARKEAQKNIKNQFITRNAFTVGQVQYTASTESEHTKITDIRSFVGITHRASYMERQELGGRRTPVKGKTLAIPTDAARGGSKRNAVQSAMRLRRLGKARRVRGRKSRVYASKKAKTVARAYMAYKTGKFVSIDEWDAITAVGASGQTNLYRVTQFVKNGRYGVAFRLEMIYSFDKTETQTHAQPWLFPASDKVARQAQAIFNAQMKRIGL